MLVIAYLPRKHRVNTPDATLAVIGFIQPVIGKEHNYDIENDDVKNIAIEKVAIEQATFESHVVGKHA